MKLQALLQLVGHVGNTYIHRIMLVWWLVKKCLCQVVQWPLDRQGAMVGVCAVAHLQGGAECARLLLGVRVAWL
jgi:hypothetical protein